VGTHNEVQKVVNFKLYLTKKKNQVICTLLTFILQRNFGITIQTLYNQYEILFFQHQYPYGAKNIHVRKMY